MRHPLSLSTLVLSLAAFAMPAHATATSACPVELTAEHHGLSQTVPADRNTHPCDIEGKDICVGQSIDLSIKNTRLQRIVAAELEVHGTSNRSRAIAARRAMLTTEPTADAMRSAHLISSVPADESRTNTVSVKDLTSVAWINVIELRYADGSVWQAHRDAECRVTPNPIMLIAGNAAK